MMNSLAPLLVTLAIQVMTALSMMVMPVLATNAAADVGVSATYVGLFVALIYLGAMISSVAGGALVLRFGAIRVSQACLLICAAGLVIAMLGQPSAMIVSALVIGAGYGPITPASSHVLAKSTPAHLTGLVFSLKQTGVPLGGALAGILMPPLVIAMGWRGALACAALICLVVAVLAQTVRASIDNDCEPGRRIDFVAFLAPLKLVLGEAPIRALALASILYSAMQLCLMGYLVNYLVQDLALSLVQAGVMLAVAQTGGVFGRIVWGTVADRWIPPRRMFGLLGLTMAGGAAAAAWFSAAWPNWALAAAVALFGAAAIGWNGVMLAQVARLAPPGKVGLATGGTLFFTFFGVVTGPPLFGAIVGAGLGYPAAYLLLALPALLVGMRFTFGR
jgi:MFS family permease